MNKRYPTVSSMKWSWQRRARRAAIAWLAPLACAVAAVFTFAQYRVNTQIYGNTSSSVRYGRSYTPNYAAAPTYNLLPSENRNLVYRSGALPSTIRMNAAAIGPMAPQGVSAYVPQPQSFRSSAVTPGNYVNTVSPARVTPMPAARGPTAPGMSMPSPALPRNPAATGSMCYAIPPPSGVPVSGFSMSSGAAPASVSYSQMVSGSPVNWTPQSGSIKYSP
jgi:hypothetical protein